MNLCKHLSFVMSSRNSTKYKYISEVAVTNLLHLVVDYGQGQLTNYHKTNMLLGNIFVVLLKTVLLKKTNIYNALQ